MPKFLRGDRVAPSAGAWALPKGASFQVLRHSAILRLADGVGLATDGSDLPKGRISGALGRPHFDELASLRPGALLPRGDGPASPRRFLSRQVDRRRRSGLQRRWVGTPLGMARRTVRLRPASVALPDASTARAAS